MYKITTQIVFLFNKAFTVWFKQMYLIYMKTDWAEQQNCVQPSPETDTHMQIFYAIKNPITEQSYTFT